MKPLYMDAYTLTVDAYNILLNEQLIAKHDLYDLTFLKANFYRMFMMCARPYLTFYMYDFV